MVHTKVKLKEKEEIQLVKMSLMKNISKRILWKKAKGIRSSIESKIINSCSRTGNFLLSRNKICFREIKEISYQYIQGSRRSLFIPLILIDTKPATSMRSRVNTHKTKDFNNSNNANNSSSNNSNSNSKWSSCNNKIFLNKKLLAVIKAIIKIYQKRLLNKSLITHKATNTL